MARFDRPPGVYQSRGQLGQLAPLQPGIRTGFGGILSTEGDAHIIMLRQCDFAISSLLVLVCVLLRRPVLVILGILRIVC